MFEDAHYPVHTVGEQDYEQPDWVLFLLLSFCKFSYAFLVAKPPDHEDDNRRS